MVNNNQSKQYYIPMEMETKSDIEFAKANGYSTVDFVWRRIGNRNKRVLLIPCTKEEYLEYMRPIWKEMKRKERQKEYFEKHGIQSVSLDYGYDEFGIDIPDTSTCQEDIEFQEILDELRELLDKLQGVDKTIMDMYLDGYSESDIGKEIGMSQKGVNKRKNKVITNLKLHFQK